MAATLQLTASAIRVSASAAPPTQPSAKRDKGSYNQTRVRRRKLKRVGPASGLSFEEKLEIIKLLDSKVARPEVARRFGCGITAIASVKREKAALEAAAATNARSASSKSARGGDFPKGDAESGGGRKVEAPPLYSDLSSCFGPLEQKAESAGNSEAAHFLRKAKMAFLVAHAAKPTRQADIRMFSES